MLGTTFASTLPFLKYLRPANSPFLIIVFVGIIAITNSGQLNINEVSSYFFYIPIYIVLISTTLMSFAYKPADADILLKQDSEEYNEKIAETDNLFKFSRSVGLSASIVSLYLLFYIKPSGFIFILTYIFIAINLIVFSVYLFFRTIQEESPSKSGVFQIAFLTAGFLVGGVSLANKTNIWDGHLWTSCSAVVVLDRDESKKKFNEAKILADQGSGVDYGVDEYETLDEYLAGLSFFSDKYEDKDNCTDVVSEDYERDYLIFNVDKTIHYLDWQFISYIILFICWTSYMLFWIIRLKDILKISVTISD